jgi:FkbM family methyltransferase
MNISKKRPVAFVVVSTNHGTMIVNRHDYRLIDEKKGYGVGFQLLNNSAFDPEEVDLALQILELRKTIFGTGVIAIDCGANVGVHTIEWAKLMYEWGEVIAIEAQERIYYALAGNITVNNCLNARALWAAVGASSGEIGVPVPDYYLPSSFGSLEIRQSLNNEFIGQSIDYENVQITRMVTIDELNLRRLDLIKIDIEGMEMEALMGSKETLEKCKPVVLIEKIKSDSEDISSFLIASGYRLITVGLNYLAIHKSDPISDQIESP